MGIGNLDACPLAAGMYHLAVADINRHMVDGTALAVEEQVSGLGLGSTDLRSVAGLGRSMVGQINPVFFVNLQIGRAHV